MYKIYLTKDILGDIGFRLSKTPLTMCKSEQDCYHNIKTLAKMMYNYDIPYVRKTIINDCKITVDFGFHTLFYEIEKE